jgi:predicted TIM-barrel fold metal-dependent hydrolase
MVQAERTLMFSSDYPHWDFDDPTLALQTLPPEIMQRVRVDNAVETFGDRL